MPGIELRFVGRPGHSLVVVRTALCRLADMPSERGFKIGYTFLASPSFPFFFTATTST